MKQIKILSIIFGMIFLIGGLGIASAENSLYNLTGITIPVNAVAGDTFTANFSFDYYDNYENKDNSPLIIQLNFTSNDTNFPVWKGDFQVNGTIEKKLIFGFWNKKINFTCSENETQQIVNPLDTTTITNVSNGTFYCYNEEGDLKLNEHDEVFLNITSHPALFPGKYDLTAKMFYLDDTTNPIVEILNKMDFERYYKPGNYMEVKVNITEARGLISNPIGKILASANYSYSLNKDGEFYYFRENIPGDLSEGDYLVNISATDNSGNVGSDNVTLKIDLTAPTIELVSPTNESVYEEIIPLKLNVSDEKSGVNSSSVYYRLREIVNGVICPEYGTPLGNYSCARTDWININLNSTSNLYEENVNTTELNLNSGAYWLEAKASDLLGNEGQLL